jgi:hypothetical protein
MLREHVVASGLTISTAWALATWRGMWLMRSARRTT